MNFGKWIVVAFVLFATFIATLVTVCMKQDVSLVSKEYYKEELAYQEQIKRLNNTARLTIKPVISVANHQLEIRFDEFNKIDQGEIKLFCPSNAKMDRDFKLNKNNSNSQTFSIDDLKGGMYKARLLWTMNGKEYYQEEIIYI